MQEILKAAAGRKALLDAGIIRYGKWEKRMKDSWQRIWAGVMADAAAR